MYDLITDTEIVNLSPLLTQYGLEVISGKCFQYGMAGVITIPKHIPHIDRSIKTTIWLDTFLGTQTKDVLLNTIKFLNEEYKITNYSLPIFFDPVMHIAEEIAEYCQEHKINTRYRIDPRYINQDEVEHLIHQIDESDANIILGSRRQTNFNLYRILSLTEIIKNSSDVKFSIMGKLTNEDVDLIYNINDPKCCSLCLPIDNFSDLLEKSV